MTLEQPTLLVIEDDASLLSDLRDDSIVRAGMNPAVQRELAWTAGKSKQKHRGDYLGVRNRIKAFGPIPTIAVVDFALSLSEKDRNGLVNGDPLPGRSGQIDGLALVFDLMGSSSRPTPLLVVVATREGRTDIIIPAIADKAKELGLSDKEFLCIPCSDVYSRDVAPAASLPEVSDLAAWFMALKELWNKWVFKDSLLKCWLSVWSKEAPTTDPGHFNNITDYPDTSAVKLLLTDSMRLSALKAVFCGRANALTKNIDECVHLDNIADTLSLTTAGKLVHFATSLSCEVEPPRGGDVRIHWPCTPGAAFIWRLQMFIQALNEYNEVVKIEFCDSSEVRLTIPMNDAFHFWGAVLTRTKGGAVTAFRNLLAGRVPGASELEAFYLDLSLTCGIRQVSTFSQPQALRTTGQIVFRPVCRVVVTKGQLILSWPVTPQQGQVR